jgi:hypothetical protein
MLHAEKLRLVRIGNLELGCKHRGGCTFNSRRQHYFPELSLDVHLSRTIYPRNVLGEAYLRKPAVCCAVSEPPQDLSTVYQLYRKVQSAPTSAGGEKGERVSIVRICA